MLIYSHFGKCFEEQGTQREKNAKCILGKVDGDGCSERVNFYLT